MIDPKTIENIRWFLLYNEGASHFTGLSELFQHWWTRRRGNGNFTRDGKEHWKKVFYATVEEVRREIALKDGNGRCPTCGKKIKVRRCLACDLESGVLT